MTTPFLGEIRIFGFNFAPRGWAFCNGQLLPISQNTALFSLLGTTYGGNGTTTFALPNLQARAPLQQGQGPGLSIYSLGEEGGTNAVTLLQSEMPSHTHGVTASTSPGSAIDPANDVWGVAAVARGTKMYTATNSPTTMNGQAFSVSGSSQPHNNMPPYLTLNFCIAMQGIYPARN